MIQLLRPLKRLETILRDTPMLCIRQVKIDQSVKKSWIFGQNWLKFVPSSDLNCCLDLIARAEKVWLVICLFQHTQTNKMLTPVLLVFTVRHLAWV